MNQFKSLIEKNSFVLDSLVDQWKVAGSIPAEGFITLFDVIELFSTLTSFPKLLNENAFRAVRACVQVCVGCAVSFTS